MKFFVRSIAAGGLLATLAIAQPSRRYTVTDLGPSDSPFAQATDISYNSIISGFFTAGDGAQHAALWYQGRVIDISKPGLLGPNSLAFSINPSGQASYLGESTAKDPNNENFCAYGTGLKCLPFFWQSGYLTPLPLLGGNNGTIDNINARGEVLGIAETATRDPACTTGVTVAGTGPQVLDFEAVVWGPKQGEFRMLRPLPGDTVGVALWINDAGEAVGATGTCANTVLPPLAYGPHAVLWRNDGTPHDLGNLSGGFKNVGLSINNQGQVVGGSQVTDTSTPSNGVHAFLWTRQTGKMQDLGTLPGDVASGATSINDPGDVVGVSFDPDGNPRAFLWRNGTMTDLNTLVPDDAPLFPLFATAVNSRGEIVGFGATQGGDVHGFLLTPANGNSQNESAEATTREVKPPVTSEKVRVLLRRRFGIR